MLSLYVSNLINFNGSHIEKGKRKPRIKCIFIHEKEFTTCWRSANGLECQRWKKMLKLHHSLAFISHTFFMLHIYKFNCWLADFLERFRVSSFCAAICANFNIGDQFKFRDKAKLNKLVIRDFTRRSSVKCITVVDQLVTNGRSHRS